MKLQFEKFQATGNDFVMVDNRDNFFPKDDQPLVARLCDRKFGIGADGLILVEHSNEADFKMVYYNADGGLGSFCGNGSRAASRFAKSLGLIDKKGSLMAFDGLHELEIDSSVIKMAMTDVQFGRKTLNGTFIDTGSPHYVEYHNTIDSLDVFTEGRNLRQHENFKPGGANINFVEIINQNEIKVRTFERGVENETLSCGTGVTASALSSVTDFGNHSVRVTTPGGILEVTFEKTATDYTNIHLIGPAEMVFQGELEI